MRLYIARHAKSSQQHRKLADIDRPLNKRGRRDAAKMAGYLAGLGVRPDWLITSDSVRTRTTAQIISAGLGLDPSNVLTDNRLYLADADTLLDVLRQTPGDRQEVMLIGHNPGVTELVARLTGAAVPVVRQRAVGQDATDLPTMAVATLDVPASQWQELNNGCAALVACVAPKQLPGLATA